MAFEIIKKWCGIGTKTAIPDSQDGAIPNRASYDEGFPDVCSDDPNAGGLPPRRADINQILYLTSNNLAEIQAGNYPTFDSSVSTYLGGYPENSILWCASQKYFVRSTKASNTDNFVTTPSFLGTSWVKAADTTSRTPFCINSGNVDANGDGDLLSATGNVLSFKVGGAYPSLIGTTADGTTFTFATLSTLDFTSDSNGTYNVFVDNLGALTKYANTIYRQKKAPTSPTTNDFWLKTSLELLSSYKFNGTIWVLTSEVPIGQVVKSGTISAVTTFNFNYNGYNLNTNYNTRTRVISWNMVDYSTEVSKNNDTDYVAETDLWAFMISNAGSVVNWGIKITVGNVYDFATMDIYNANDTTIPFQIRIPKGATYRFQGCSVRKVYQFLGENNA